MCGEEEVQEVVAYVLSPLLYPSLIGISLQSVGCLGFSHIWVSTLTSYVSSLLLFISVFLCIDRLLGCGRVQRSESIPVRSSLMGRVVVVNILARPLSCSRHTLSTLLQSSMSPFTPSSSSRRLSPEPEPEKSVEVRTTHLEDMSHGTRRSCVQRLHSNRWPCMLKVV